MHVVNKSCRFHQHSLLSFWDTTNYILTPQNSAFKHGKVTQHNVGYSLWSNWPRFARTHSRSRTRHWCTARSMILRSKWHHSSTSRCFRWSTSRILVRCTRSWSTHFVVDRIQIRWVRWTQPRCDVIGSIARQNSTVSLARWARVSSYYNV